MTIAFYQNEGRYWLCCPCEDTPFTGTVAVHYFSGGFKYEYHTYGGAYPKPSGIECRRFDKCVFTYTSTIASTSPWVADLTGGYSISANLIDYAEMVNLESVADYVNPVGDWVLTGGMTNSDGDSTTITGTHPNLTLNKITSGGTTSVAFTPPTIDGSNELNKGNVIFLNTLGNPVPVNPALSGYFNGVLWGTDPTGTTNNYITEDITEDEDSYYHRYEFVIQQTGASGSRLWEETMSRLGVNKVQAKHDDIVRDTKVFIGGDINTVVDGTGTVTKFADIDLSVSELDGSFKFSEIDDISIQPETCLSFTNITANGVSISPTVTRF